MTIFKKLESNVRSYCRSFPTVFVRSRGALQWDEHGRRYIDFFAGAGALNYGHNNPELKKALVNHIMEDGVTHSLDMHTVAKRRFLEALDEIVLRPRGLDMKVMFPGRPGPTRSRPRSSSYARRPDARRSCLSPTVSTA